MCVLLDKPEVPKTLQPTRQNMIRWLKWLVQGAMPGDSLFLHFSGHGGQEEDLSGDEEDGFDETICPSDYAKNGDIKDDELFELLVRPLPVGARLTAIFDCCHSGSVLDLAHMYNAEGEEVFPKDQQEDYVDEKKKRKDHKVSRKRKKKEMMPP